MSVEDEPKPEDRCPFLIRVLVSAASVVLAVVHLG
jgi:hypothetical protein